MSTLLRSSSTIGRKRGSSLIPRFSLPSVRREYITGAGLDERGFNKPFENYSFQKFTLEMCTVQPLSSWAVSVLPEGLKAKECYTIFSQQTLQEGFEGTQRIGDAVYIPKSMLYNTDLNSADDFNGGWFVVAKTKPYRNNVITHCESVVYRDHTLVDDKGNAQFPDTTLIEPFMIDDAQFKSGQWSSLWED